jgi:hypothetical protein
MEGKPVPLSTFASFAPPSLLPDFAIVVGINRYPGLTPLEGPENDAKEFASWLTEGEESTGRTCDAQIIVSSQFELTNDPASAKPMVSEVDQAFNRIFQRGKKLDERLGRRLTIFLAGHGFTSERSGIALLTAEATADTLGFHIPGRRYADSFLSSGMFEEVVLFMDSCRDSYPKVQLRDVPFRMNERPGTPTTFCYGFAASWAQRSREKFFDDERRVRGIFSRALVDGLRGLAVRDLATEAIPHVSRQPLGADDLESYVMREVDNLAPLGTKQDSQFEFNRKSPMILTYSAAPRVRVRIRGNSWPRLEVIDPEVRTPIEGWANDEWAGWLPRGAYEVRETDGRGRRRVLEVSGRQELDIDFEDLIDAGR